MAKFHPPLIAITCDAIPHKKSFDAYQLQCDHRYTTIVKNAGGHPVLLPIAHRPSIMRRYLDGVDGLVIVGGDDVDPKLYGETPIRGTNVIYPKRSQFEIHLYRAAKKLGMPVLGICYGMQLINVLEGGTLYQRLPLLKNQKVNHNGKKGPEHVVRILRRTRLGRVFSVDKGLVGTEHHQGIKSLAPGFLPVALAEDGIIEGIENPRTPQILAVQWHPERTPDSRLTKRLLNHFIRLCREYKKKNQQK